VGIHDTRVSEIPDKLFYEPDFVPSLREMLAEASLAPNPMLGVPVPVSEPEAEGERYELGMEDRHEVPVCNDKNVWLWRVDSLKELFRGDRQPPVLGDYPEAYHEVFYLLDRHVLEISRAIGARRDAELREIFSALRRRPDGRSLGMVHDYFWQVVAFILGTRILSQAEFEAIMARMERSCRTFERGPTSFNLVTALQSTLR